MNSDHIHTHHLERIKEWNVNTVLYMCGSQTQTACFIFRTITVICSVERKQIALNCSVARSQSKAVMHAVRQVINNTPVSGTNNLL